MYTHTALESGRIHPRYYTLYIYIYVYLSICLARREPSGVVAELHPQEERVETDPHQGRPLRQPSAAAGEEEERGGEGQTGGAHEVEARERGGDSAGGGARSL